jgi:hypothetical protein
MVLIFNPTGEELEKAFSSVSSNYVQVNDGLFVFGKGENEVKGATIAGTLYRIVVQKKISRQDKEYFSCEFHFSDDKLEEMTILSLLFSQSYDILNKLFSIEDSKLEKNVGFFVKNREAKNGKKYPEFSVYYPFTLQNFQGTKLFWKYKLEEIPLWTETEAQENFYMEKLGLFSEKLIGGVSINTTPKEYSQKDPNEKIGNGALVEDSQISSVKIEDINLDDIPV